MPKISRKYYLSALGALLVLSAYPLFMGLKAIALQVLYGGIRTQDYARWVIPYTAVCLALLIGCALYPLLSRLRRLSIPAATVLALGLFTGLELFIEGITIRSAAVQSALKIQLFSCVYTPAAVTAFNGVYDDSYKIHYFLVSFILISLTTSLFYGFGSSGADRRKKVVLGMQAIVWVLFLGLCVLANFTGFFRVKADALPPLSTFLTAFFFVVLGTAVGVYIGSGLIGRGKPISILLPALIAMAACCLMYFGEYSMFKNTLYRFGTGWFNEGLPGIALAPADVLIVLAAGGAAAGTMAFARRLWHRQAPSV